MQVNAERQRYLAVDQKIHSLDPLISAIDSPTVIPYHDCSYSSNGAVFATRFLGCDTGLFVSYLDVSKNEAKGASKKIQDLPTNQRYYLSNTREKDTQDIISYGFQSVGIDCLYVSSYYDETIPSYKRNSHAPSSGVVNFIEIDCGGSAKAEYFPVVKD